MVETHLSDEGHTLILQPHCSMTWQQNKMVLAFMVFWSGSMGIGFTALGAWPVMPFIGLELAALAGGLYYACWKLSHREVFWISGERITLERGVHWPKQRWEWPKTGIRIQVTYASHLEQVPTIELWDPQGQQHRLGAFLNRAECEELITNLTQMGLPVRRSHGAVKAAF